MDSKQKVKELVLDQFRKGNLRDNDIIMMRVFINLEYKLPPKQRDVFYEAINELITEEYIIYEKSTPECLRLTKKGYDYIYMEEDEIKPTNMSENSTDTNKEKSSDPSALEILNQAITKVPFVKYALGIAGVGAAIAIVAMFVTEDAKVPVISLLIMLGLMVLLFVLARVAKSKEVHIKYAGFILLYFIVAVTCLSCALLITAVFFDFPKPIGDIIK
ncbi:hypothetical protein [Flavobacterium piscis]|uniref:DUF1129 family protein n=1 Tax=Flavobacterium piscis TaxID=1114874 RepID=A0ABU1Y3J8_9FLAO|nr:hypothetical protein [Flavobacterium piscis]MDR7208805.1 hypothetical protein [Flavobacterium piscis]